VPAGIFTTTVEFKFNGDGSAAKNWASETPTAVHVAVTHNWAEALVAQNRATMGIRSKGPNVFEDLFIILDTGELSFETVS